VSRLVRDVVTAIYDEGLPGDDVVDPATVVDDVLIACRSAAGLLAERVGREDADAYRHWLDSIATRVCHAARSGDLLGYPAQPLSPAQRQFLSALAGAFER
jgi:hypothetical protein